MNCVVNPISLRVGFLNSWSDSWYVDRMYYPIFLHKVLLIKTCVFTILFREINVRKKFEVCVLFSHLNIYLYLNKIFLHYYFYDSMERDIFYDTIDYLRWGKFKKIRLKSFWLKKQILDQNFWGQRFYFILQTLNIFLDCLIFENLNYRFHYYKEKKIKRLKLKYKKNWMSKEEIYVLKKFFDFIKFGMLKNGITFLQRYYKKWYYKIKKFNFFKRINLKLMKRVNLNYKFILFVVIIFNFLSIKINYKTYEHYYRMISYKFFLRIYTYWFVHRPVLNSLLYFLQIIINIYGIQTNYKIFIIDNSTINAEYLARYLATCLQLKFNYRDLIMPIKRNLQRLLKIKKFRIRKKSLENRTKVLKRLEQRYKIDKSLLANKFFDKFLFNFYYIILNLFLRRYNYKLLFIKDFFLSIENNFNFIVFKLKFENLKKTLKNEFFVNFAYRQNLNNFLEFDNYLNLNYLKMLFYEIYIKLLVYIYKINNNIYYLLKNNNILNWNNIKYIYYFFILNDYFSYKIMIKANYLNNKYKLYLFFKKKFNRIYYKFNKFSNFYKLKKKFFNKKENNNYLSNKDYLYFFFEYYLIDVLKKNVNEKSFFYKERKKIIDEISKKKNKFKMIKFFLKYKKRHFKKIIKFMKNNIKLENFFINKNYKIKIKKIKKIDFIICNINFFLFLLKYNIFLFYKSFIFNINEFFNFMNVIKVENNFIEKKKSLMPIQNKYKRFTLHNRHMLYGYKFHFKGRLRRKERAANVWIKKGALPVSMISVNVDYSFYTVNLKNSAFSAHVWLYKGKKMSNDIFRL